MFHTTRLSTTTALATERPAPAGSNDQASSSATRGAREVERTHFSARLASFQAERDDLPQNGCRTGARLAPFGVWADFLELPARARKHRAPLRGPESCVVRFHWR